MESFASFPFALPFLICSFALFLSYRGATGKHEPPGPKGYPIIGNALQIPRTKQWLKFKEWCTRYGDVVYISIMGTPTVILGSLKAANDLLEIRGNIYSDRPRAVMAGELVGWARGLGYSQGPPSLRFRAFRRIFHTFISPRAINDVNVKHALEMSSLKLAGRLMNWGQGDPQELASIVRISTASLILRLSYGYDVDGHDDPLNLIQIAEDAMRGFARASEPGAYWVDSFPWLKYIPSWVPWTSFHRVAREMRADLERLYDVPLEYVKKSMADGTYKPSFVSQYLEQIAVDTKNQKTSETHIEDHENEVDSLDIGLLDVERGEAEEFIKAAAASLYSGGEETTPSSIMSFILAMLLFPDVQARAQAELDDVVGYRLPTLDDVDNLPYVRAIVTEVWRWGVSVPLGLPHVLSRDDTYRGYVLKKGTVIWANIWSIMHDPKMFPTPTRFQPERYLGTDDQSRKVAEAVRSAFGFGRRICPGLHLAENSLFITIATILFTLRISKAVDESGNAIEPEVEYEGFISHPRPFRCNIEPRLANTLELLNQAMHARDDGGNK